MSAFSKEHLDKIVENATDAKVHVSPEGTEERVVDRQEFLLTQTAGGGYRYYVNGKPTPDICMKPESEAKRTFGRQIMVIGSMIADPKKTIQTLLSAFKGSTPDG